MNRWVKISAGVVLGVAGTLGVLYAAGARVNTSGSIPEGLYWISHAPVAKGEYVMWCPPKRPVFFAARARGYIDSGFCPGGLGYMMKKVLAAKGDTVAVTAAGVTVNGTLLPDSAPLPVDGAGRRMPNLIGTRWMLGDDDVLLMTDRSRVSFDARYFGTVSRRQVRAVIHPVITW